MTEESRPEQEAQAVHIFRAELIACRNGDFDAAGLEDLTFRRTVMNRILFVAVAMLLSGKFKNLLDHAFPAIWAVSSGWRKGSLRSIPKRAART